MIEIAQGWVPEVERAGQIKAANNFRLPYWDYWKPRGRGLVTFPGVVNDDGKRTSFKYDFRIPDIFVATKVMVRRPEVAKLVPMDNPLVSFSFPKKESDQAWDTEWRPITSRHSEVKLPVTDMNNQLNMVRESNNTLFNNIVQDPAYQYYADFGKNAFKKPEKIPFGGGPKGPRGKGSLENLHNTYHISIGGIQGHMADTSVAAFDPVFWIHHW